MVRSITARAVHRVRRFGFVLVATALLVGTAGPTGSTLAATSSQSRPAAAGDELWTSFYASLDPDQALDQALSPDGAVLYVTGLSGPWGNWDYLTVAYQVRTGRKVWAAKYDGPLHGEDTARAVAVSPDGTIVFVTGESPVTGGVMDYATVAYEASTGEQLWAARYDGPAHSGDSALDVVVSGDGSRVFVTGGSTAQTYDWATIAYDAESGEQLWVERYDGAGNSGDWDYGNYLALGRDSSILYVTGWAVGTSQENEFTTIAYDAVSGGQIWVSTFHTRGSVGDFAGGLAQSPDGQTLYVTGATSKDYSDDDWTTLALSAASGSIKWVARYAGPAKGFDDPFSLVVSPGGGRVFVTGNSDDGTEGGSLNYATIAYDASTGDQLWLAKYDGPDGGWDSACCIGMARRGATVYIAGYSAIGSDFEFATIAYDAATGAQVWLTRSLLEGRTNGLPHAMSVQPNGVRVLVSGESSSVVTQQDFTTIAYQG